MPKISLFRKGQKASRPTVKKFKSEKVPRGQVSITIGLSTEDAQYIQDTFEGISVGMAVRAIVIHVLNSLRRHIENKEKNDC